MEKPACYKGQAPYIFVSYAHKDSDRVWSLLHRMAAEGIRVWYDDGIELTECWDENIAQHVEESSFFIAFITSAYLASEACKDELLYARDLEAPTLLIYLDDVKLPGGLAMRCNRLQALRWCDFTDKEKAWARLWEAKGIRCCCDTAVATPAKAEPEVVCNTPADFEIRGGVLIRYRGKDIHVRVPDGVDAIADGAFEDDPVVRTVSVPEGVTRIGKWAFGHCANLHRVSLPESLREIGDYAFSHCGWLEEIQLPEGLLHLGNGVFHQTVGLPRVEIGLNAEPGVVQMLTQECLPLRWKLSDRAVLYCQAGVVMGYDGDAETLTLPEGIRDIGLRVFAGHGELAWVELPDSLRSVGEAAFADCTGLKAVRLGDGLTQIGDSAFSGCTGLKLLDLPETVRRIGKQAVPPIDVTVHDAVGDGVVAGMMADGVRVRRVADAPVALRLGRRKNNLCPDCESPISRGKKCPHCVIKWK